MEKETLTVGEVVGPEAMELASQLGDVLVNLANEKGYGYGEVCKAAVMVLAGCAMGMYGDLGIPDAKRHAQRVLERALEVLVLPLVMHND